MTKHKKIKVRLAVAMNENGDWCCESGSENPDDDWRSTVAVTALGHEDYHRAAVVVRYVEAELTVPSRETVQGEVAKDAD